MSSTTAEPDVTPQDGLSHRQIVAIIIGLMMGMFLAALDQTIVSTAIRTIADDLNGFSIQVWATTAFLITSTIATPLYGKLSDLYGPKPFFLFAISVFVIGSALCGLSQSMYELAAFRAIQGIGAGGLMALPLTIIGDVVPPRERARYQGYFLAVFGTSSVLGPVLGGLLAGTDAIAGVAGWRWIFYVNVPLGLAALVVVQRVLTSRHERRDRRIDYPGALALVTFLVPLLVIAEQGRTWGWLSGRALVCYAIGLVGLGLFLLAETRLKDDALLPLRLFRGRTFAVASASSFIMGIGMFGALLTLPLYLQIVKGLSPTSAGLATVPLVVGIMSGSVIAGQTISRTGRYRWFPIVGTLLMVVALLLFSRIGADTPLWRTMLIMPLMGLGLGWNMQPIILATQNAVSPREIGVATSSVTFFRSVGGTLGAALFLSVLFSLLPGRISTAVQTASTTPEFQQATRDNPAQAAQLQSGSGDLNDTSFLSGLADVLAHPFKVGFSDSMSVVFLIGAAVILVGLVVVWFLPELPLQERSAAQARADLGTQADGAGTATVSAAALADPEPHSLDGPGRPGTDGAGPAADGAGRHEADGVAQPHEGDGKHAAPTR
jgi:EmrB/QacA subfamily drug resistance transporter